MTDDELKRSWDYAWNYFSFHADQRLKTFTHYVALCTAVGAVTAAIAAKTELIWVAGIFVAAALVLLSTIFWRLDIRNRQLVHHGEDAIRHLEQKTNLPDGDGGEPHLLKIMVHEEFITNRDSNVQYSHCL